MKYGSVAMGLFVTALSACGGGGGDGAAAPSSDAQLTAEGLYSGTTSSARTVIGLVLDDGSYYVLYSLPNNPAIIAGAVVGSASMSNGSFSSSNARDVNLEGLGLLPANISGSYTAKKSLNGTVTYTTLNQSITFASSYDAAYGTTPMLSTIAGTYSGQAGSPLGVDSGTFSISATGAVSATTKSGCKVTGSVAPRAKGNVYSVSVTFGGSPCWYANKNLTGAAYYDATTKRMYAVGLTSARDGGLILAGSKVN